MQHEVRLFQGGEMTGRIRQLPFQLPALVGIEPFAEGALVPVRLNIGQIALGAGNDVLVQIFRPVEVIHFPQGQDHGRPLFVQGRIGQMHDVFRGQPRDRRKEEHGDQRPHKAQQEFFADG